jgi:hypothetical protein
MLALALSALVVLPDKGVEFAGMECIKLGLA